MNSLYKLPGRSKKRPGSRPKWLFFFIVAAFIIGAIVVSKNQVFTEHSVLDDLDGLVYGVAAFSHGDVNGFFDGILDSATVIGLFMVVFALFHFLFTKVLHNFFRSKSVATTLALAISIYAFINNTIYNYMISLNAFTVAFLVFCAVLIMIWGFTNDAGRNYKRSRLELQKARDVARQQYANHGYVDKDLASHIRRLQKNISKSKEKYRRNLTDMNRGHKSKVFQDRMN